MIKITRISETKRGRFALFDSEEFLFSVDAETLAKHELSEGSSLEPEELVLLKQQSDTRKAKDAALRYLSLRAYGEKELYGKLCRRYDEHSAAAAVAEMRALGMLNDETFGQDKARGLASRGKSRLEIRRQLSELGLDKAQVENAMNTLETEEHEVAVSVLRKGYMEKLRRGEREKVLAAMARRGFGYRDVAKALEVLGQEEEFPAGNRQGTRAD